MSTRITNFERGREIQRRLHELVPGGSHTYSKGEDQFPYLSPQIMVRAQGAYTWDADGNRFLDWAMGNRVLILGHNDPVVNEAVKRQIDLGLNFTRPGILEYELAEYLIAFWGWPEMVKFGKNGSDVTTAAVKLARAVTGRKYIACCGDHPFFSIHDWFIGTTPMSSGIPDEEKAFTLRFRYNDIGSVEDLFSRYPGQIAGLILEPVKNEEPRDGFLERLREVTKREGAALIFDEMISAMKFDIRGAHHLYGVEPDMATFGKAISNGFCFSALAGRREFMEVGGLHHEKPRVFLLSQTHSSETTGLAACRATLDECQRVDVSRHVWSMGNRLVSGLRERAEREGVSAHVRSIGFDCNPQILCTHEDGSYWPELHTLFHEEVIANGVLIPWTTITYAHKDAELEETLDALQAGMKRVAAALEDGNVEAAFAGPAVRPVFRPFNRCEQSQCGRLNPDGPQRDCCAIPLIQQEISG
jgi:glutamate-1-semialdehyde 2,1-aminomutase